MRTLHALGVLALGLATGCAGPNRGLGVSPRSQGREASAPPVWPADLQRTRPGSSESPSPLWLTRSEPGDQALPVGPDRPTANPRRPNGVSARVAQWRAAALARIRNQSPELFQESEPSALPVALTVHVAPDDVVRVPIIPGQRPASAGGRFASGAGVLPAQVSLIEGPERPATEPAEHRDLRDAATLRAQAEVSRPEPAASDRGREELPGAVEVGPGGPNATSLPLFRRERPVQERALAVEPLPSAAEAEPREFATPRARQSMASDDRGTMTRAAVTEAPAEPAEAEPVATDATPRRPEAPSSVFPLSGGSSPRPIGLPARLPELSFPASYGQPHPNARSAIVEDSQPRRLWRFRLLRRWRGLYRPESAE
jgi:hypothetical protein